MGSNRRDTGKFDHGDAIYRDYFRVCAGYLFSFEFKTQIVEYTHSDNGVGKFYWYDYHIVHRLSIDQRSDDQSALL